jgi:hypothetical protein
MVYIDLNTSSANGLVNGTYNYSSDRGAFIFVYGEIGVNVDLSAENENGEIIKIVGGKIDVSVDGNITTLNFDLTTSANKKVTGRFKSPLILM